MKDTSRHLRGAMVPALALCLCFIASCSVDKEALARSIALRDVDVTTVADGTYEASYTIKPPAMAANKTIGVKVTVASGAYASIRIVSPAQLASDKGFAALIDRIKATGRLSMDAISSATITSAALLKAVQLAVSPDK
jgi:uncharacterized protein with FMN-binding domain